VLIVCRGDGAEALEARLARDPLDRRRHAPTTRISPWNMLVGELA
jgi:hypothetical protein